MVWSGREIGETDFPVICGAEVCRPAQDRRAAVPDAGIAAGAQRYFAKEVYFRSKRRHQMQRELPLAESTVCSFLVRSRKVDIRKSSQFQRRVFRQSRNCR